MFLFFGWACLLWQPIALTYGRRGVYLITMFLTIPIMVWTAYSSTAGEWFAHRILIGIVVSPIESLCEVTVFDLFFAHNRGTFMGLYVLTLFGSNFLAPLVAEWFNDAYGWRWTMNLGTIICGVIFIILFFFMEETIYFRDTTLESVNVEMQSTNDCLPGSGRNKQMVSEKSTQAPPDIVQRSEASTTIQERTTRGNKYNLFRPLPERPSNLDMLRMVYPPFVMIFKFPTVAWTGFLYGINLACTTFLTAQRVPC
jgi:MFS family permease